MNYDLMTKKLREISLEIKEELKTIPTRIIGIITLTSIIVALTAYAMFNKMIQEKLNIAK